MLNKIFTKSQLRPLMTVELRDKRKCICIQEENKELILIDKTNQKIMVAEYDNILNFSADKNLDIVKVYNPSVGILCFGIETACNTESLVYEKSEVDWSRVQIDAKVFIYENETNYIKRHFAKYEDDLIYTYKAGATSWSRPEAIEPVEKSKVYLAEPLCLVSEKSQNKNEDEIFSEIPGFPNKYKIGSKGTILENNVKKITRKDLYGNDEVSLRANKRNDYYRIANLMAKTFIPNPENKRYAVIKDKNAPLSLDNIFWADGPRTKR